jgi:hypothetical protein
MMEGPQPQYLELARELHTRFEQVFERHTAGEATLTELVAAQNDIQRAYYNALKERFPSKYTNNYDEVAVMSRTVNKDLVTTLLEKHPVTQEIIAQEIEKYEFQITLTSFKRLWPEIQYPEEGTTSDIFKITLRHFIQEYGRFLSPELVSEIQLNYLLKKRLDLNDYQKAANLLEKGVPDA